MATASEGGRRRPAWLLKRSARLRLTVMFSTLFLLLGTAVIAALLVFVKSGSTVSVAEAVPSPKGTLIFPEPPFKAIHVQSGAQHFVVAQQNQDFKRLLGGTWIVLVVTTVGSGVLGWFAAGRFLRPLREMASTAETITAGNLHQRLALGGPNDEFKRLGDTFDDLLARLEASFEAQRRFVANASHELRTPLTVERTLVQVALANPDASEETLRVACEELLASQVDHERLLEGLLTLASSERGLERTEPIELAALAGHALGAAVGAIERRGLRVESDLQPASIDGDPLLIARLIANLIDNAVDHNVDAGWLSVRTTGATGHALIEVRNSGVPIATSEVPRLFEPFQRLDGRSGAGNGHTHHGLGLSIVRAIATIHGGSASAAAQPGGGLAVTVQFSEAAAPSRSE